MLSRREFMHMTAAGAVFGASSLGHGAKLAAQDRFDQDALLEFEGLGNVTLMHVSDIHGQLMPNYYRPPSENAGFGENKGKVPHLTGEDFRIRYGIGGRTPMDYAFTHEDFVAHAQAYGKMGGLDRVATVVNAIRGVRPGALLLDGGGTWPGSMTSLKTMGQDMVNVMNALGPDAMTFGSEFTLEPGRFDEIVKGLPFAALGQNVFDAEPAEKSDIIKSYAIFDQNDVKIAVIGQVNRHTDARHFSDLLSEITFGVHEAQMQKTVDDVRAKGAALVVCLSQNGLAIDRKIAENVTGIDVILSGQSHDALPEPIIVGKTHIIASGSQGRFVSRIDLDVRDGKVIELRHKLIPIFSDLIAPDPQVAALIAAQRVPFLDDLTRIVARSDTLLYRRGDWGASWDDLICDALLSERDAEIALSPGQRWGPSILPGQDITREDIFNVTATTRPNTYRVEMTGAELKTKLEAAADAVFNPDPYMRQGVDMMRVGGMTMNVDPEKSQGARISEMTLWPTGQPSGDPIDPNRHYVVAGWADAEQTGEGPPIWDVLERHLIETQQPGNSAKNIAQQAVDPTAPLEPLIPRD
jgi:sulfur-oxidizing protein SoxB